MTGSWNLFNNQSFKLNILQYVTYTTCDILEFFFQNHHPHTLVRIQLPGVRPSSVEVNGVRAHRHITMDDFLLHLVTYTFIMALLRAVTQRPTAFKEFSPIRTITWIHTVGSYAKVKEGL